MITGNAEIRITVDSTQAEADIKRTTAAVDNFNNSYKRTNSNVLQFNRSLKKSTVQLGDNRSSFQLLKETVAGYNVVQIKALQNSSRAAVAFDKQRQAALRHRKTLTQLRNETLAIVAAYHSAIQAFQLYNSHVIQTKDSLILLRTQIENVTKSQSVFNELADSAFDLGVRVQDLTNFFTRLGISTDGAFSTDTLIDWSEKLVLTCQSFGLSMQEVNSAVRQFSQGLSLGKLQGDELRSVLENMPPLAKELAETMNTTRGNLQQLGREGKITVDVMAKALNSLKVNVDNLPNTFEKAVNRLSTSWAMFMDQVVPEDSALTSFVNLLAEGLNYVAKLIQQTNILLSAVKVSIYDSLSAFSEYLENEKMATYFAEKRVEAYKELTTAMARMKDAPGGFDNLNTPTTTTSMVNEQYEASQKKLKAFTEEQRRLADTFGLTARQLDLYNLEMIKSKVNMGALTTSQQDQFNELANLASGFLDLKHSMLDDEFLNAQKSNLQSALMSESEMQIQNFIEQSDYLTEWYNNEATKKAEYYSLLEQLGLDHANKMRDIEAKGLTDRQRFEVMTTNQKTKSVLGAMTAMTAGVAQQNKTMFEIHKKLALANAIVSLPSAIMQSWDNAGGYPWGIPMAAAMLATGLAQIDAINSSTYGGTTSSASVAGGSAVPSIPDQTLPVLEQQESSSVTVQFIGDNYGLDDFQDTVVETIQNAVNDRDVIIIDSDSRQAQDLLPA